jgi:hypothetical protein
MYFSKQGKSLKQDDISYELITNETTGSVIVKARVNYLNPNIAAASGSNPEASLEYVIVDALGTSSTSANPNYFVVEGEVNLITKQTTSRIYAE